MTDHKHLDEAKAKADAEEAKIHVTEADVKAVGDKLMAFTTGLTPGERKHLFTILDREPEKGADVQGYWWRDTWRTRWWHDHWHR